jgi:hypothetical protein
LQKDLAQKRTAARVPTPDDDEEEVPSENEDADAEYTGDATPNKKGLAKEVISKSSPY